MCLLTRLYQYSFLICAVVCDAIESHLAFFCQWVAKEASVSIAINNGKMGAFGIGTACPSLVSRSAGRAGKRAWSPECSTVYQFELSALGALPKSSSVLGGGSHQTCVCSSLWSSCVCAWRAARWPWSHLAWR